MCKINSTTLIKKFKISNNTNSTEKTYCEPSPFVNILRHRLHFPYFLFILMLYINYIKGEFKREKILIINNINYTLRIIFRL